MASEIELWKRRKTPTLSGRDIETIDERFFGACDQEPPTVAIPIEPREEARFNLMEGVRAHRSSLDVGMRGRDRIDDSGNLLYDPVQMER